MTDEVEIQLGETYQDKITGWTGVATSRHEYLHGCTRITLEKEHDGEIKRESFDAPALIHVPSGQEYESSRTGGPGHAPDQRPTG